MASLKPCCRNEAATWKPAWPAPTMTTDPCAIASGCHDAEWQGVEPAQGIVQPPRRLASQFDRRHAFGERAKNRLALQPRHRLSDAAVNAGAERHMSGRAAADIEAIGLVPAPRIAVGGSEEQQHLFAPAEPHAADVDRFGGGAEERLHRRLEAQYLLKGTADQVRVLAQDGPLLGIASKAIQRVAEP